MAAKKPEKAAAAPKETPEPIKPQAAEVPGWPGVVAETPEEHDARRRQEAEAGS
jgi:hypothetical protein